MKHPVNSSWALLGVVGLASASAAMAQTAAAEDDTTLEEVIVTAQNRAQDVQDVPIAIDVVSGAELQKAGFANMDDIVKIAPAVQLNQDQGTVKVTVRGVGTNSNDEAQDTSVVINIDGEYINRPNVLGQALFDLERVEVLRGPQGTLYGRNSTGGAINFITRKPGKEFGVNASVGIATEDTVRVDLGVDIPIGDTAAVRVAGFYESRDGYVSHPGLSGKSDTNDSSGGRISLRAQPSEAFTLDLALEASKRTLTPSVFAAGNLNSPGNAPTGPGCNRAGFVRVAPSYAQTLCVPANTNFLESIDRGSFTAPQFGLGKLSQDSFALRARAAYEFSPAATLTYVGGYRSFSGDEDNFLTLPVTYRSFGFKDEADTQSHELRLNGEVGRMIYQLGAFYFKEELDRESGFFLPIGPNGTFLSYFGRLVESDSSSLFGQVDYTITDTMTAVAGVRYTDSTRDAVYRNAAPFGPMGPDPALFNAGPARKDFSTLRYLSTLNLNPPKQDEITWLVGLNYKPNPDTLVFGKVSTGFKAGGFDSVGPYKPETNTAFEAGWKQSFGDSGEHQFNLGAFYYDYQDLQVSVLLDTAIGGQTFNAGKATIWGLEASGDFQLSPNDRFSASVNYLNAEYDELLAQFNVFCVGCNPDINGIGDLDPTTAGVQQPNFAGNRPPFSPELVVSASYDHVFQLASGKLTASLSSTYKTSYYTDFYNYADGEQSNFVQSDAALEYKPNAGNYTLQAYVRNIENERPLTYGSFVSAGPDDIFNWQFGPPRIYGLRINYEF